MTLALALALTTVGSASAAADGAAYADDLVASFRVLGSFPVPEGFVGNLAYDRQNDRLFLVSFGPPMSGGRPSTLYELDPNSGDLVRSATLPLEGSFGSPACLDGYMYQILFVESKLYKISLEPGPGFGEIVATFDLPQLSDLDDLPSGEVFRFPFIEFEGMSATSDGELLAHAADLGEVFTFDPETGRVLDRSSTLKGLGGIAAVPGTRGRQFLVGDFDPEAALAKAKIRRFVYRSPEGFVPTKRSRGASFVRRPDPKTVVWALIDAETGNVMAATERRLSEVYASSVALIRHEEREGSPYGRYLLFALGPQGVLTVEWIPVLAG